jgi:hypothetical protein
MATTTTAFPARRSILRRLRWWLLRRRSEAILRGLAPRPGRGGQVAPASPGATPA